MNVRVPGWARGEAVPSDLYRFADASCAPVTLKVNGQAVPATPEKGYARIDRSWKSGDVVELSLPMPIRRVAAHASVDADQGRVALQRGPLVYAAEWPDNPGGRVRNLFVADGTTLTSAFRPELLGGVQVVNGRSTSFALQRASEVEQQEQDFTAIPYYAWANRGAGEMAVWTPQPADQRCARSPCPRWRSRAKVTASKAGHNPSAVNDQNEPRSSRDGTGSFFHWWPEKGSTEWVAYDFQAPTSVSEVEVYWLDDTGSGECRVPVSWRVLYKDGEEWKPVEAKGRVRRGEGRLQQGHVQAGHDHGAAAGGDAAAAMVGRDPGVEGPESCVFRAEAFLIAERGFTPSEALDGDLAGARTPMKITKVRTRVVRMAGQDRPLPRTSAPTPWTCSRSRSLDGHVHVPRLADRRDLHRRRATSASATPRSPRRSRSRSSTST